MEEPQLNNVPYILLLLIVLTLCVAVGGAILSGMADTSQAAPGQSFNDINITFTDGQATLSQPGCTLVTGVTWNE